MIVIKRVIITMIITMLIMVIKTVIMRRLLTSSSSRPVVREKLACGSMDPSVSEGIIIENQRREKKMKQYEKN